MHPVLSLAQKLLNELNSPPPKLNFFSRHSNTLLLCGLGIRDSISNTCFFQRFHQIHKTSYCCCGSLTQSLFRINAIETITWKSIFEKFGNRFLNFEDKDCDYNVNQFLSLGVSNCPTVYSMALWEATLMNHCHCMKSLRFFFFQSVKSIQILVNQLSHTMFHKYGMAFEVNLTSVLWPL